MKNHDNSPTWPIVLEFAERMEAKLERNRHKGDREGWLKDEPEALLARLREETSELVTAMEIAVVRMREPLNQKYACENVANEAADVANFAMMIQDWYFFRTESEKGPRHA